MYKLYNCYIFICVSLINFSPFSPFYNYKYIANEQRETKKKITIKNTNKQKQNVYF